MLWCEHIIQSPWMNAGIKGSVEVVEGLKGSTKVMHRYDDVGLRWHEWQISVVGGADAWLRRLGRGEEIARGWSKIFRRLAFMCTDIPVRRLRDKLEAGSRR